VKYCAVNNVCFTLDFGGAAAAGIGREHATEHPSVFHDHQATEPSLMDSATPVDDLPSVASADNTNRTVCVDAQDSRHIVINAGRNTGNININFTNSMNNAVRERTISEDTDYEVNEVSDDPC